MGGGTVGQCGTMLRALKQLCKLNLTIVWQTSFSYFVFRIYIHWAYFLYQC